MNVHSFAPGARFGRWRIIKRVASLAGASAWQCVCACGRRGIVRGGPLRSGKSKSCGCLTRERSSSANRVHGWRGSATYKCWSSMRDRCRQSKRSDWSRYGGRGIKVCKRWNKFANFLADMGPRPERMTIERKNVHGDYRPGNCCWATAKEQANNRTSSHLEVVFGETKTAMEWSEDPRCAVCYDTLLARLSRGWDPEFAITAPPRARRAS